MRLLGSEILSVPFRADFKTGRVSAELLGSSGGNVLLSQLVSPFNLFLRQDSYSNFNCKKHLLSTYATGLSQVMCGGAWVRSLRAQAGGLEQHSQLVHLEARREPG